MCIRLKLSGLNFKFFTVNMTNKPKSYPMRKDYKGDSLATKDTHRWYHLVHVLVISLAVMITLLSVVSSVWFRLRHRELELQLQIEQTCLERIGDDNPSWNCDNIFMEDLLPVSVIDAEEGGTGRVKRDDRNYRRTRRRNRNRKRSRVRRKKPQKKAGYHLVIDSTYSQPGSPKLTTNPGEYIPYWKVEVNKNNREQKFAKLKSDGSVEIKKHGLYYIYSQITYYDKTGSWSHRIDVNDKAHFKCMGSEWGVGTDPDTNKFFNIVHQCYTGGATHISKGNRVAIRSMYPNRTIHADSDVTFWGIVKLK